MNTPLIDEQKSIHEQAAESLDAVAALLRNNKDSPFGGCFVVVPPEGGGEKFWWVGLDSVQDPVLFFQLLSARIKALLEKLDQQQRTQQAWR